VCVCVCAWGILEHIYTSLLGQRERKIEINPTYLTLVGCAPSSGSCVFVLALEQAQTERNYCHMTPEA